MVKNFSVSYFATTVRDNSDEINQQQLRELKENWKQKNRRGLGYYAKQPETAVMNSLKQSLITSATSINEGLFLPNLPVANWLNVAVGLLISIKSIRQSLPLSLGNSTPLLNEILSFIYQWISCSIRIKPPKRTSVEQMQLLNTKFQLPIDPPNDVNEQLHFILQNILLPTINHPISIIKIYYCTSCNFMMHTQCNISYIPINVVEGELQLHHRLNNYFNGASSDHLCEKCSMTMARKIKLLDCKKIHRNDFCKAND